MIKRVIFLVLILSGTALAGQTAASGDTVHSISLPAIRVELKPGPGMEKTSGYCGVCHSLDYITTQPAFSTEKWGETVNKMVKVFGAPIPPDAAREITGYLGSAYGKTSR
ncbi:MAG TPA: hypothetical protein VFG19_17445 [Geobacteraceae bacterium]|nr:hypothetical protein [Geobacteraceae bacterium]